MSSSSYAIVREGSGEILRTGECSEASLPLQAVDFDEILIHPVPEWVNDDAHYWAGNGFVEYPPRPTIHHQWSGSDWLDSRSPEEITSDELAAINTRREEIRLRRDQAIDAGTIVAGLPVATDDKTQTRIMGAALSAMLDPDYSVDWKTASGTFVTFTGPQVIAVAQAIRSHVQACFDREAVLLADLENGRPYDIDAGWPS